MLTHVTNFILIYQQVIHTSTTLSAGIIILLKTHAPTSGHMVIISKNI
jgi:hypothetical protein